MDSLLAIWGGVLGKIVTKRRLSSFELAAMFPYLRILHPPVRTSVHECDAILLTHPLHSFWEEPKFKLNRRTPILEFRTYFLKKKTTVNGLERFDFIQTKVYRLPIGGREGP